MQPSPVYHEQIIPEHMQLKNECVQTSLYTTAVNEKCSMKGGPCMVVHNQDMTGSTNVLNDDSWLLHN